MKKFIKFAVNQFNDIYNVYRKTNDEVYLVIGYTTYFTILLLALLMFLFCPHVIIVSYVLGSFIVEFNIIDQIKASLVETKEKE